MNQRRAAVTVFALCAVLVVGCISPQKLRDVEAKQENLASAQLNTSTELNRLKVELGTQTQSAGHDVIHQEVESATSKILAWAVGVSIVVAVLAAVSTLFMYVVGHRVGWVRKKIDRIKGVPRNRDVK